MTEGSFNLAKLIIQNHYLRDMDQLPPLNLPPYPFKITEEGGTFLLFDDLRKKHIIITPEEWVRQHFVRYLVHQKNFPKTLIKLEGGLRLNGKARRSDIVAFNPAGDKILMVECKAPSVNLDQKVFDQIARYNIVHRIALLAVSNGLKHYYCRIDFEKNQYIFLDDLPDYRDIRIS